MKRIKNLTEDKHYISNDISVPEHVLRDISNKFRFKKLFGACLSVEIGNTKFFIEKRNHRPESYAGVYTYRVGYYGKATSSLESDFEKLSAEFSLKPKYNDFDFKNVDPISLDFQSMEILNSDENFELTHFTRFSSEAELESFFYEYHLAKVANKHSLGIQTENGQLFVRYSQHIKASCDLFSIWIYIYGVPKFNKSGGLKDNAHALIIQLGLNQLDFSYSFNGRCKPHFD